MWAYLKGLMLKNEADQMLMIICFYSTQFLMCGVYFSLSLLVCFILSQLTEKQ